MIHLYTASTPNGHKVSCLLEALEMPYEVHSVNLAEGEQKKPEFLKVRESMSGLDASGKVVVTSPKAARPASPAHCRDQAADHERHPKRAAALQAPPDQTVRANTPLDLGH